MRILFVDDNQDTADSLAMLVTMLGHDAVVAYTATEALEVAAASLPDVIFMDIWLGTEDGREVGRLLRQMAALSKSKIIALTGTSPSDHPCEPGLFDEVLMKPITVEQIEAVLRRYER